MQFDAPALLPLFAWAVTPQDHASSPSPLAAVGPGSLKHRFIWLARQKEQFVPEASRGCEQCPLSLLTWGGARCDLFGCGRASLQSPPPENLVLDIFHCGGSALLG